MDYFLINWILISIDAVIAIAVLVLSVRSAFQKEKPVLAVPLAQRKGLIGLLFRTIDDVKAHWNMPRPGEFVSDKKFLQWCLSGMFTDVWGVGGPGWIGGFGMTWFCGSIMNIEWRDFVSVGVLGTILGYVFLFMSPIGILIYENHGQLNKPEKILMHSVTLIKIAAGFALYFFPADFMEGFLKGFPYILANALFIGGLLDYLNWFVRWKFCAKYGRVKPFILLYAIPAVSLGIALPWINYPDNYHVKIALLHGIFMVLGHFTGGYNSSGAMVPFMTQNTQERQRMSEYGNLIRYLLSSLLGIVLPILATSTLFGIKFNYPTDINVFRYFGLVFGLLTLLSVVFILPVKENLIEQKINRPKVTFFKGAANVFKNKYWWITNTSGILGNVQGLIGNFFTFWVVYQMKSAWLLGITGAIMSLGGTCGSIFVPSITKRYNKVKIYKIGRFYGIIMIAGQYLMFRTGSMWGYVAITFALSPLNGIFGGVGSGFGMDILDYHQWRFGERADAMQGVFGWITNPIVTLLGYIGPYIFVRLGYTSDWDVMYNPEVFLNAFNISFALAAAASILAAIPWLFYDLTPDKHRRYVEEIKERVRQKDIAEIEEHIANGTLKEISPEILAKYGYDINGVKLEEPVAV